MFRKYATLSAPILLRILAWMGLLVLLWLVVSLKMLFMANTTLAATTIAQAVAATIRMMNTILVTTTIRMANTTLAASWLKIALAAFAQHVLAGNIASKFLMSLVRQVFLLMQSLYFWMNSLLDHMKSMLVCKAHLVKQKEQI